ncbi:DUF4272 domain-containing protein [Haloglycomyces albus]|uniref:DUF4272 domain-containing protein n=1 Tax=Haloglycomyces albus TaxID=526067 RepID=UPI0004A44DAC|nr:DUF4272 domain-containing protein [Haloglycomyces albus]
MTSLAVSPLTMRQATMHQLRSFGLTVPSHFQLLFPQGQSPQLRSTFEIESRLAIINVIQARVFNMPEDLAMRWLLDAHILDHLVPSEWGFIAGGRGDRMRFSEQCESLYALAWVLGLVDHLDPRRPCEENFPALLPDLRLPESFADWRGRQLNAPRTAAEATEMLDLYFCLDWLCDQAYQSGYQPPGGLDDSLIWHRRWVLEWVVTFAGETPAAWDQVQF